MMNDAATHPEAAGGAHETATLLFVDDEANILSALKRLFRPQGYRIFTAAGGAEGLAIMEQAPVDLVISDMRMPEMSGAQFLEQVRQKWPDTVRILLTGYADISSTIEAINKGHIYRYVAKPWDDNDVVLSVNRALERKHLEQEKRRLEILTRKQNEELKDLNAGLEEKVEARTEEVRQTMAFLEMAHEKLKKGFLTSIRVFSNLVELREGSVAGHGKRVAENARGLARRMGLKDSEVQDVFVAGLLHDIGKIGLSDRVMDKPFSALTGEEKIEVIKHPARGQSLLMALEQLNGAASLIRSHHERFDGKGYPDGLSGMNIPLGARILALANDYDGLQYGTLTARPMTEPEAREYIRGTRGTRYDPQVVDAFLEMLGAAEKEVSREPELQLRSTQMRSGMVLARDIVTDEGILLLSKGYTLNDAVIAQIHTYETLQKKSITIYVRDLKG